MGIHYIKQDVTRISLGIVAHGVNCQHKMGSGVAKVIRETWPQAYESYMNHPKGKAMLGCCSLIRINEGRDDLFVANLYTQMFYGYGGKYASVQAIETSLSQCANYGDVYDLPIYMPRIGCGLGGLDWENDVEPIVQKVNEYYRNDIYICDLETKMLNENQEELKFIVKVNGQVRTSPLLRKLAEAAVLTLPENERSLAELVPVTKGGKELLLES